MIVEGVWRRAIECEGRTVRVLDQQALPFAIRWVELATLDDAARAIRDMTVRGAPLIGATAAYGVALAGGDPAAYDILAATRPTAVNLRWALDEMRSALAGVAPSDRAAAAYAHAAKIADEEVARCEAIGAHGLEVIELIRRAATSRPVNILTHCNAGWLATVDWGTAIAPIYRAHAEGIPLHVWVDETRPRNQGLLTAWELAQQGIPHTLIADNAGGHLMQHGKVDLCIVGTDRTTRGGDVCNKIGTYLKALAAHHSSVPFYVAAPSPSIDWTIASGADIPIEERSGDEVRTIAGHGGRVELVSPATAVCNPAFDVTPARFVTGIITERGTATPGELAKLFGILMTLKLRDDLVATARRMSELGLTPGTSGNVSVRTTSGFLVTPSGMSYSSIIPDDLVEIRADGHMRPGQRKPSSEWQLHRDVLAARRDCTAIVHTHSLYCTTIACLRRPIPAIHYMITLAGSDEIPCAEYATFGSAELAANVVRALADGRATLMANHGMVALGDSLASALHLAAEIETLAAQFWHAVQIGTPVILDRDELARVRGKIGGYGQQRKR